MKAIDAHVHLVPSSPVFRREARKTGATHSLAGLRREMRDNDVERAVLISHWRGEEGRRRGPFTNRTNNDLVNFVGRGGDAFRGVLTVNIGPAGAADLDVVDAHLRRRAFAGVKFFTGYETFSPTDPRCEPVYELLGRRRAVAMFHTGDTLVPSAHLRYAHPLPLDEVAVAHPRMTVVVAHAGQHWMHEAGELIGKNPNVWADLSGWFMGRRLPWFADLVKGQFRELVFWADGCDRLMFGTDWPLMRMAPYLAFMEGCDFLSTGEKRKILYDNARRLYWG